MPSNKVLEKKQQIVEYLTSQLSESISGVIVSYKGINVADDTALRKELRQAGVNYAVVKNTLLLRACEKANLSELEPVLKGSTAIATSTDDYVAPAKILQDYINKSKNETFKIKSGFIDGEVIDVAKIEELAKLPSREELIAKALGGLNAPITGFVSVLHANLRGLVVALSAVADQKASA